MATWEEIEFLLNENKRLRDLIWNIQEAGGDALRYRVELLKLAENKALGSPMSRQERACRKATRDAYQMVLDLMNEGTE
jgi:hypothetical protein